MLGTPWTCSVGSVDLFDVFTLDVSDVSAVNDAPADLFVVTRVQDGAGNTSYSMALSGEAGAEAQPLVVDLEAPVIGAEMALAEDVDIPETTDVDESGDLIIAAPQTGTITFSADEEIASARLVQLKAFEGADAPDSNTGDGSDLGDGSGTDGSAGMEVYSGADISGIMGVVPEEYYILDEQSFQLVEVEFVEQVDGQDIYGVIEGTAGTDFTVVSLTDADGVADFKALGVASSGTVPAPDSNMGDGSDLGDGSGTGDGEFTDPGSGEPSAGLFATSYDLTSLAEVAGTPLEYTAELAAGAHLTDGVWGLELTDLAGNVTVAEIDADNFAYGVTTRTTLVADTASEGVFVVDTDADNNNDATVKLMRGTDELSSISSIGARNVELVIAGLDEDVSNVTITITSAEPKLLGDGSYSEAAPYITAELSYDGSAWSVDVVDGTWTSIDATSFVHNDTAAAAIPSFIVDLAGTTGDEGLSNGAFSIDMEFTDIAGNTGSIVPVEKRVDNSADEDGDLGVFVDEDILGGISLEESSSLSVELRGRDSDVFEANIFALTAADLTSYLVEIPTDDSANSGFVASGARLLREELHDELDGDGNVLYQYAVFENEGKKAYLNLKTDGDAAAVLNTSGTRFETITFSQAARSGIRLEPLDGGAGDDPNAGPSFDLKVTGLDTTETTGNYTVGDALTLTIKAVDKDGVAVEDITVNVTDYPLVDGAITLLASDSTDLTA